MAGSMVNTNSAKGNTTARDRFSEEFIVAPAKFSNSLSVYNRFLFVAMATNLINLLIDGVTERFAHLRSRLGGEKHCQGRTDKRAT